MIINQPMLKRYMAVFPPVYAFIMVFFFYENLTVILLSALALVLFELWGGYQLARSDKKLQKRLQTILPFLLIVVGSIGITAATILTREKLELLADPERVTPCSISPIVACSPVITSPEASAFSGLPNPIIGVVAYAALIVAGMSLLAGGVFARWWWRSLWLGTVGGMVFVVWLIAETLYDIGALCVFCMVAWSVTIPTFYYVTLYNLQHGHLSLPKKYVQAWEKYHLYFPILTYLLIIILIYFRFDDYWQSLI